MNSNCVGVLFSEVLADLTSFFFFFWGGGGVRGETVKLWWIGEKLSNFGNYIGRSI